MTLGLCRIRSHVDLALEEDALREDDPRGFIDIRDADVEVVRPDIDLTRLDRLMAGALEKHERYSTAMDVDLVKDLHQMLPLTRREAADRYLWAWLGLCRYPHLVAWRWKPGKSGLRALERFQGNRVRQCFARLWWAAELTVDEDRTYELTARLFRLQGFQDVYEAIFGRDFCHYRPALAAFTEIVGPQPEQVVRETAKEFGYILTTMVLEALDDVELKTILVDLVKRVRVRTGL